MDIKEAVNILAEATKVLQAGIMLGKASYMPPCTEYYFDLTNGLTNYRVETAGDTVLCEDASDLGTYINIRFNDSNNGQSPTIMKLNKVFKLENFGFARMFIDAPAQAGKYIKIKVYSGVNIQLNSMTTTAYQVDGNSIQTGEVSIPSTQTIIATSRVNRGGIYLYNKGTTDVWIGGSAGILVGQGILLQAGQAIYLKNTSQIWGISASGTNILSYYEDIV